MASGEPEPQTSHSSAPGSGADPLQPGLLGRLASGDPEIFQVLVRPLLPGLLSLARRLVGDVHWAEDLVQETLVRAYRGVTSFRGDSSLQTWLYSIQLRLARQPERWRRQEKAHPFFDLEIPDYLAEAPEAGALSRELRDRLDEAMERLSRRQRTALHLRAVEGLDYRNIASILGSSRAAARMLVLAARRKVLERMGGYLQP